MPSDGSERHEETEWHNIVAWSKLAEICSQILEKGRKVYLEGRIQNRKWQTQEGEDRETTEIVIDNMIALGSPKSGYAPKGGDYGYSSNDDQGSTSDEEVPADDIPSKQPPSDLTVDVMDGVVEEVEKAEAEEKKNKKDKVKSTDKATKKDDQVNEEVSADDIPF
jgi:single-strand DNA-binding protein